MTHAHVLSADEELHTLAARSNVRLERVMQKLIRAKIEREDEQPARNDLRRLLAQTLALASLLGSRRTLLQAKAKARTLPLKAALERSPVGSFLGAGDTFTPFVPEVEFQEAIDDLLTRHPTLAAGYKRVQEVYSQGHAFALAKSTDLTITKKVQDVVAKAIKQGSGQFKATQVIQSLGGWNRAYADVVFTTNAASAYSAGVIQQAYDPEVMEICPAMEFIGRDVAPSRPNHIACVGLIAGTKDRLWDTYSAPLGYRCSHGQNNVDRWDLKDRGLLIKKKGTLDFARNADGSLQVKPYFPRNFRNAGPDPGFGKAGTVQTRLGLTG